jgi:hypothetical protein
MRRLSWAAMRQASGWLRALSDKALPLCPRAERNSQPLRSSDAGRVDVGAQGLC